MQIDRLETDLVIIGSGFMAWALAEIALSRGKRMVIIEKPGIPPPHYMTGFIAPRADYLRFDKEEVELASYQCRRFRNMFPDVIRPKLFIMPFHPGSPYSYSFLKPLMELYDKVASARLGDDFQPSFRISGADLEKIEPSLRKNFFTEALGFYELTANPDHLLSVLREGVIWSRNYCTVKVADQIGYNISGNIIDKVNLYFNGYHTFSIENKRGLTVVNTAGPWMQDVAAQLGILLPVEYQLGFQLAIKERCLFNNLLVTFGRDGKYVSISQEKDHIRVGPTNTKSVGPTDIDNPDIRERAARLLLESVEDIIDPGIVLFDPEIRTGGLRVKLKLPMAPDTNRPFTLNIGFDNYHVLYPGKAVLALRAAEEFLDHLDDGKKFVICLNGKNKFENSLKLNWIRIKSLTTLGFWYLWSEIRKILHM